MCLHKGETIVAAGTVVVVVAAVVVGAAAAETAPGFVCAVSVSPVGKLVAVLAAARSTD